MGLKGGGSIDTSGIEKSAKEANALYQKNYEDILGFASPYYDIGTQSTSKLSDLLGLSGGSVRTEQDIYNELLPQYTQSQTFAPQGSYTSQTGEIVNVGNIQDFISNAAQGVYSNDESDDNNLYRWVTSQADQGNYDKAMELLGYNPYSMNTQSTNYDALNAAVASQLASQETPEGYGSLLDSFDASKMQDDSGYQYRMQEAQKALERQMAAQGVTLGGGGYGEINPQVYKAMNEMTQGMASQEYGNAYNRYVNDQANMYNMLMGTAGLGSGALNTMANTATGTAAAINQTNTGLASAQLNAQMAEAAQPSMFDTLLQGGVTLGAAYLMSDARLKENIEYIGVEKGHNIYEFDYKDGSGRYRGVMAQEVMDIDPEAVVLTNNGYYAVNYEKIGVTMEVI